MRLFILVDMVRDDHHILDRRELLGTISTTSALGLAGCFGGAGGDNSQSSDYPTENIELVVPYATGGGFDTYARITKPYWQEHLPNNPTVNVQNVVGGGGVKGATQVYNVQPNGYTFMIWDAVQAITQQIGRNTGYKIREMSHIGALTQSPNCLITMNSANISGWNDLINRSGDVNFATQGVGAISHIGVVLLGQLTGAWSPDDINFVHYGGTGEALAGLERGEAQVFLPGTATSGLKVIRSLEAEMMILFSQPVDEDSIYHGVPKQYSSELSVKNMDRYADLTVFRRFFTGPPGVPEEVLNTQRESFLAMVEDEKLINEAEERSRPIVNPGSAEEISDSIKEQFEAFGSNPLKSIIQSTFQS